MVVINNMSLPGNCTECRFYYGYTCHVNGIRSAEQPRVTDAEIWRGVGCPLRELDVLESLATKVREKK